MRNLTVPNADIHAVPAWDIFTGNPNAIIAIIDNGVDNAHNDLNAKILGGDNGFQIDVDGLGRQFSHGSHVAGIAAAVTNNANNNGVAGVDWQARIHPRNIFDGNGDPDITQSIIDAMNFNANVWTFNNSWGMVNQDGTPGRYSVTVRSAFAQAYRNNRVQCVAMGNHQQTNPNVVAYPAGFNSGIIAVGATDDHDNIASFSAQGPHIDVSAPGVGIWSTNFNNGYIDLSGTSMATPHVSGLASLLKGFNTNLANDDIEQIIRLTADDQLPVGFDNAFGTGRINALRAIQSLQTPNTLQHLSTTGGTIFSTSANMTRIFLGMPGLADAAYIVKRSEIRKAIALPAMCSTVGVWGRGVGTSGYREENGRCFGEGICEIVPGTLTSTSATLRTWVYEVWGINGQYYGFYPSTPVNAVFQYTVLGVPTPTSITGDDIFCTPTSNNYTIPNLPTGANVTWTVTPLGIATPDFPSSQQTTLTKNGNGVISLSAIITNACPTTITLNKPISVGIPPVTITGPSSICPCTCCNYYTATSIPGATYTWSISPESGNSVSGTGNQAEVIITSPCYLTVQATTPCGTSSATFHIFMKSAGQCSGGCSAPSFAIAPNPAQNTVTISLLNNSVSKTADTYKTSEKHLTSSTFGINLVRIYDASGNLVKQQKISNNNTSQLQMDVSSLISGTYSVVISAGTLSETQKVIIQR